MTTALDRTEASRPIVGVGLFNLGIGVHDKRTARDDRLIQRTTGIEQGPQWFVLRLDRHLGCLPALAAREPTDVARCYELAFSADGAVTLQDDNDRVVVGGEILAKRGAWVESDFDHCDGHNASSAGEFLPRRR